MPDVGIRFWESTIIGGIYSLNGTSACTLNPT